MNNREIKFREFVNGKFHYWGFVEEGMFKGPVTPSLTRGKHSQFTGLFDKNKTPIYEGDILRCYDSKSAVLHSVGFEDGRFIIEYIGNGYAKNKSGFNQAWVDEFSNEVIGNIHENSELLTP